MDLAGVSDMVWSIRAFLVDGWKGCCTPSVGSTSVWQVLSIWMLPRPIWMRMFKGLMPSEAYSSGMGAHLPSNCTNGVAKMQSRCMTEPHIY